jgi:hypothetical protein
MLRNGEASANEFKEREDDTHAYFVNDMHGVVFRGLCSEEI